VSAVESLSCPVTIHKVDGCDCVEVFHHLIFLYSLIITMWKSTYTEFLAPVLSGSVNGYDLICSQLVTAVSYSNYGVTAGLRQSLIFEVIYAVFHLRCGHFLSVRILSELGLYSISGMRWLLIMHQSLYGVNLSSFVLLSGSQEQQLQWISCYNRLLDSCICTSFHH
jgi:hypothetical protein